MRARTISMLYLTAALAAAGAVAQPGNLAPNGQFANAVGVGGWTELYPWISTFDFAPGVDAFGCPASGSAHATADPDTDFGTAEFNVCVTGVMAGESYKIAGRFLFDSDLVEGRANVSLNFYPSLDCSGTDSGGQFAGYARSYNAGWQTVVSGPVVAAAGTQSALLRVLLTQDFGAQPALEVYFDDILLVPSGMIFGDGLEGGGTCRWDAP